MKPTLLFKTLLVAGALTASDAARAQLFTNTLSYTVNQPIPDNDLTGFSDTRTVVSQIFSITDVRVTLNISGGFNGDYYAYLTHGSGFSVLLNRVGRTISSDLGYPDSGFNVVLDDAAANDIHTYRLTSNPNGGPITGTWQPDGRNIHPTNSFDTTIRTAGLGNLDGLDANGDWTLFLADVSAASTATLNSWGIEIVGVPEPTTWALLGMGGVGLWLQFKRKRRRT